MLHLNPLYLLLTGSSSAPTATVTATVLPLPVDAEPLSSTPASLPALPTGTFAVSLNGLISNTKSCLNDTQNCAWDCSTGANLSMIVTMASPNMPMVSLTSMAPSDGLIRYGSQPPQLNGPAKLVLMNDKDDFSKGPAYTFQQPYNKLVIVHEGDMPGAIPSLKRSLLKRWFYGDGRESRGSLTGRQDDDTWTSNSIAKPVDRPWFCYWNNTILEGFIFTTQDANPGGSAYVSPSAAATSSGSVPYDGSRLKRQSPPNLSYPNSVKIEERRPPKPSQAYCQQMQVLNSYRTGPVLNPDTQSVNTVYLNETESQNLSQAMIGMDGMPHPAMPASPSNYPKKRGAMQTRSTSSNACQCGWMDG